MEDYLNQTALRSTERQAVNHLNRLTPNQIDVSRCTTLKDAWDKLTDTYGSPVYIACLLLKDFFDFKLTKANNETNMLQLNNAMDKLESDLIINKCAKRREDFMVIDHAESLISGRFHHKFVEKKDQLLMEQGGSFFKLSLPS